MAEADIIGAIVQLLKSDGSVSGSAGARVYGGEIPPKEAKTMPEGAIVVRASGGVSLAAGSFMDHDTQRVDMVTYAETPFEAEALRRLCRRVLVNVRRQVVSGVLIHWIEPAGGFSADRDRDATWPYAFQSFQAFYALQEV